ncbi:hypothetical protein [uncultured Thiodictyon sp.]|uniref:hypothetical protein n=1 Tax=uncultured Thiodictyon sp. TaxID=1846217 RepID=UPI0025F0B837|nr:hypothetical protein [uncultured Thiodictyon sp.]
MPTILLMLAGDKRVDTVAPEALKENGKTENLHPRRASDRAVLISSAAALPLVTPR